jgi:hypothetical protein
MTAFLFGLAAGAVAGYWSHASDHAAARAIRKGAGWALSWIGYLFGPK